MLASHRGWGDTVAVIYNWIVWGVTLGRVDYRQSAIDAGTYSYYFRPRLNQLRLLHP